MFQAIKLCILVCNTVHFWRQCLFSIYHSLHSKINLHFFIPQAISSDVLFNSLTVQIFRFHHLNLKNYHIYQNYQNFNYSLSFRCHRLHKLLLIISAILDHYHEHFFQKNYRPFLILYLEIMASFCWQFVNLLFLINFN